MPRSSDWCTGILLAGGASRRLPPNKLLLDIDGEPLFWHPLRALAAACAEVVIVIGHGAPAPDLPQLRVAVRVARDATPDGGPLVGLAAGLAETRADWAVLAAGDTPRLRAELLLAMRDRAGRSTADVVALVADGRPRPLPMALRVARGRLRVGALVAAGEARLRAIFSELATEALPEEWWRPLDPAGDWLRDVDRPEDLAGAR